jgi:hypothetical protein
MTMDDWILVNDVLLAAGAMLLLVAGILAQRAWRGRLVHWSPCCRACRFDLRGVAGASCPECGADLGRPGAVTEGLRHHRIGLLAGAGMLTVLAAGLVVSSRLALPSRAWVWWLANRPVWAMEGVLRDQDQLAWQTIDDRDRAGTLSDADLRFVLATALELPTFSGGFLTPSWAWLINQHERGRVSTESLKPIVLRALESMDVGLGIVPAGQRAGGPVQITASNRVAGMPVDVDAVQLIAVEADLDGTWVPLSIERPQPSMRGNRALFSNGTISIKAPERLGPCALRARVRLVAREPSANLFRQGAVLAECERVVALGTLRVLDPTATFALGAHDETFRARVHALLTQLVGGFTPRAGSSARSRSSGSTSLAPNEGFDFDLEGVQGDHTVALGRVSCVGSVQSSSLSGRSGIDPSQPWILRLVPRLDRVEAELTEPTRIYDATIEIPRGPIDAPERDPDADGDDQP